MSWQGPSALGGERTVRKEEGRRRAIFTRRAGVLGAIQLGLFGFLGARLYKLQIVEGQRYATLAEENRVSARLIAPPRGRVLDRQGRTIAANQLNWRALLVAEQTTDVAATLSTFSRIVPFEPHERAPVAPASPAIRSTSSTIARFASRFVKRGLLRRKSDASSPSVDRIAPVRNPRPSGE